MEIADPTTMRRAFTGAAPVARIALLSTASLGAILLVLPAPVAGQGLGCQVLRDQMTNGTPAERARARALYNRRCGRPTPTPPPPPPPPPPGPGPTVNARASDLRVGAQVRAADGAALGTIRSADATGAIVNSSMGRARIPLGAFGLNNRGLVLSRARLVAGIAAGLSGSGPRAAVPFTVFFDNDKDEITPAAAAILDNAAAAWRRLGNASALVILGGHTDSRASDDYSAGLSQRMASNVRTYLMGRGVPQAVISTVAYGESRPLVETPDGVREPQNRRVEITFAGGAPPPAATSQAPQARGISITSRCATPLAIRIVYFDGSWKYPTDANDGPGLWWTVAPGATTRLLRTDRSVVAATSNELYYALFQGSQPVALGETRTLGYGQGQSYAFRQVRDVTINSNGDWAFQIC